MAVFRNHKLLTLSLFSILGGVSTANAAPLGGDTLYFSGLNSIFSNGGFQSVTTPPEITVVVPSYNPSPSIETWTLGSTPTPSWVPLGYSEGRNPLPLGYTGFVSGPDYESAFRVYDVGILPAPGSAWPNGPVTGSILVPYSGPYTPRPPIYVAAPEITPVVYVEQTPSNVEQISNNLQVVPSVPPQIAVVPPQVVTTIETVKNEVVKNPPVVTDAFASPNLPSQAVPEPGTLILLSAGIGVAIKKRRQK